MLFQNKLEAAQKELSESEIWRPSPNPIAFKLLRKLGLNVRPLHYNSFTVNFLSQSIYFGVVWGLLMWFTTWQSQNMPIQTALISSVGSGSVFGLLMATYYWRNAKKHNLSSWQQL